MRGDIAIVTGPASTRMGGAVCHALQLLAGRFECRRLPDAEIQIEVNGGRCLPARRRARDILQKLPLTSLTVTDSVATELPAQPWIHVCTVAALVATAIRRHHNDESLADLRASA